MRVPDTMFHRVDTGFLTLPVAPFSRSIENVISGLAERVYYTDALGTRKPACKRSHADLLADVLGISRVIGPCNRATRRDFIASRTGSKRKMYEAANQQLTDQPTTLAKLARLSFFVKFESTTWSKPQVPRIISPRTFGYNLLLGRYIRPVEHKIFEAIAELGYSTPVIAKGLTQEEKAQLIVEKLRPGWACVGLDASRFDQCVGREVLLAEHALYNQLYGDRLLAKLLACQLHNRGLARAYDGFVHANIGPMRCSGDQNTSLGNCLISCLLLRRYVQENNIGVHDMLCDGDDILLFVPECVLPALENLHAWYLQWGFRMKVEPPARCPEQVEFCQSHPVELDRGWCLVRNPKKALNTDYAHGPRVQTWDQFLVHLRAVGLCGMSMAGGVPVFQSFYRAGVRLGKTGKWDKAELHGLAYQHAIQIRAGHTGASFSISERARESFRLAFGMAPAEQELLERSFERAALGACHNGIYTENNKDYICLENFYDG